MNDAPAPWSLTGRGYIAVLKFPDGALDDDPFTPMGLKGRRLGGNLGYIMLVDYSSSAVGPYYELLFIPGRFKESSGKKYFSISRIFVSSQASVDNGRANWGIPKECADFDLKYDNKGGVAATVSKDGKAFCTLRFTKYIGSLPVTTALLPNSLLTLVQHWQSQHYVYAPSASGRAGLAQLQSAWADPAEFADLNVAKPVLAVATTQFRMTFPIALIKPLAEPEVL